ncbi:outer membrane protein assembly factor BamA [Citreicella sp. C3M06]|uniref:outer membrane protein assembly factor BamA n=1 Tax=Citreicella sp. C3M06 TaxID=2841564 RepID=UPI001C07F862|nr:outer membrane protein assembly factor BamA [Citreicella sp. C3M06]MBU2962342.1 outer membrane protein assembly factor BamA [Citreicella sp. C3M06]
MTYGREGATPLRGMRKFSNGFRKGVSLAALSVAFSVAVTALPDAADAQTFAFGNVQIEGNERIEAGTILSYAGIARGESVSAAELNDAYQRIVASGLFETVEILPQGGTLVIKVVEYPTVNVVAFEGNSRIKDDDLAPLVRSQGRRVYNPRIAEEDAAAIANAYVQQGRISARVTPKLIKRSDNRVDLVYEIFEGGVTEVERIGFVGNQAYSDGRLRRVLETKQAGLLRALIRSDTFITDRIAFDRQLLQDFYASRGYVDFRITGVNAELSAERDAYFVTFNVEEGQSFDVGAVTVESDLPEVDIAKFTSALKLKPGQTYSPSAIDTAIARLERLTVQEGLQFVRIEPQISRNDRDLTLDVTFQLTRGERIFVERIDIEGNTTTLDRVIRRQFDTAEGDPFNPRAIREAAERIRALGYFTTAEVNAREGSSPQQVIVDVNVEEKPTGAISFGGSYSTSSGFGAAISFSEQNFLGRGQTLSLGINTASSSQAYNFNFTEPYFLGRDVSFGLGLNYTETDSYYSVYDTAKGAFRPSIGFALSDQQRLSLRYTYDYNEITDSDSDEIGQVITAEEDEAAQFESSIGYTYSYDSRRTGLNPNAGVLLEFGQDFGGVGGDTTFIKTNLRAIAQTKIWNEEVTLRASFEAGNVNYTSGESRVTTRFLLSDTTMRGFEYGGIGPREYDEDSDVDDSLGGNNFAVARFEAEFPLGLPEEYGISGGLFYDIGSVWGLSDSTSSKTTNDILYTDFSARHVIGVSVLWDSILGPLRLNFSKALKKEEYDEEENFSFAISTEF